MIIEMHVSNYNKYKAHRSNFSYNNSMIYIFLCNYIMNMQMANVIEKQTYYYILYLIQ